jgi:hypothetical protein
MTGRVIELRSPWQQHIRMCIDLQCTLIDLASLGVQPGIGGLRRKSHQ